MAVVLEFDELPENAQVMVATQSGGCIIGRAVPAGGGGAFSPTLIIATDANHVFNGDGSGGALQLGPVTIVQCQDLETALRTFKLDVQGVGDGWLVFMNLEGVDPGGVQVTDENDINLFFLTVASTHDSQVVMPAFYCDAGHWILLRSVIFQPD